MTTLDAAESAGPFIGRERETGILLEALNQADAGRGQLILVGGEPGIGKSRLVDEFAARARDRGAGILWGRAWEEAGAPAYWPWIQALRAHLRGVVPDTARNQLGLGAADIAQMLPEIRTIVPDVPPPQPDSDAARFQLFDSTTSFLRNVARDRATVLVLEDLHAADAPSILLLRFVASQLAEMRLLAVATYRDIELSPADPLARALVEMVREPAVRVLGLDGLREAAVDELIRSAAGVTPSHRLARNLWLETKGNPLFVGEAIRLLAAEGRLAEMTTGGTVHLAIPAGVREVIRRRVRRLSKETVETLAVGAALGPEFGAETLRRVGPHPPDRLLELLNEAIGAGLLAPVTGTAARFRFSHDLIREALYQETPPSARPRLHARIAETLEEMHARALEGHFAELAHHYHEAARGSELVGGREADTAFVEKALIYARRAGELAIRSLAFEEAARLYRLALGLIDTDQPGADEARTELLLAIGEAESRAGDIDTANAAFLEAAALARRTGIPGDLARAALGMGGRIVFTRPGMNAHLIPLLQEALVMLGGSDDRTRVRLLARLACAWRSSPEHRQQSAALSKQALELARHLEDPPSLCYALVGRYWAICWPETVEERLSIAGETIAVAESLGDPERLIDAHLQLLLAYTELGLMAETRLELAEIARLSETLRQPSQGWIESGLRAELALMEGDFESAEELMATGQARSQPVTLSRDEISAVNLQRFLLARERGTLSDVEATVRASVEAFPWYPLHRAALALLLIELRREVEARAVFEALARNEFSALYPDNEWLLGVAMASEACWLLGDSPAAETLYEQLLPFAGRHAIGHAEGSVGAVDRYLGLLAMTMGQLDEAVRHLGDAVQVNERIGARPWTAHCRHDLARALRLRDAPGDHERAEGLEQEALNAARQIGLTALAERIESAGVVSEPARSTHVTAVAGTFHREGEYWSIAFVGDSFRLRDTKGLRYLSRLLAEPGKEILALELASVPAAGEVARLATDSDLTLLGWGGAVSQLDVEAKAAYRQRLHDLREELVEAESWNDPERVGRIRTEMDFLARELARAIGLSGRDRPSGSASERARLSVTRAIRSAIARIADNSPALGKHLEATIHTGTYVAYRPDSRLPITWRT